MDVCGVVILVEMLLFVYLSFRVATWDWILLLSLSFSLSVSVPHSQKDHYTGTHTNLFQFIYFILQCKFTGVLCILSESILQNIWVLLIMATTRKFWTAKIERVFSVAADLDGYSSQPIDEVGCLKMKKIKTIDCLGKVLVGTWSMDLHKEVAGLAGVSRTTLKNKGSTPVSVLTYFTGVTFSSCLCTKWTWHNRQSGVLVCTWTIPHTHTCTVLQHYHGMWSLFSHIACLIMPGNLVKTDRSWEHFLTFSVICFLNFAIGCNVSVVDELLRNYKVEWFSDDMWLRSVKVSAYKLKRFVMWQATHISWRCVFIKTPSHSSQNDSVTCKWEVLKLEGERCWI